AEMIGADLAYMGTRFLATTEANVTDDYKQMLIDSESKDIVYTPKISGVNANFMRQSIQDAGIDPADLSPKPSWISAASSTWIPASEVQRRKPGAISGPPARAWAPLNRCKALASSSISWLLNITRRSTNNTNAVRNCFH